MGNISNQSFLASVLANMDLYLNLYLDLYLPSVLLRYLDLDCTCHHFFPWYLYLDCTCHQFWRGTCTCTWTCHQFFCGTCTCTCHQISPRLNTCTCTCHRVLVPRPATSLGDSETQSPRLVTRQYKRKQIYEHNRVCYVPVCVRRGHSHIIFMIHK